MSTFESTGGDQVCPECGTTRPTGARYCPTCHYDYESFMAKYGLSPAGPALSVSASAVLPAPRRAWAGSVLRMGAFLAGLALLALSLVGAARLGIIPNWQFPIESGWVLALLLLVPLAGGLLSLIVPGRFARGPFKSWVLGNMGWIPAILVTVIVIGWAPDGLIFFSGVVINVLLATVGTSVLRLLLLIILD